MKKCYTLLALFVITLVSVLSAHAAEDSIATPEERIEKLGLKLPPVAKAVANYVPAVRTGNLIFLAGHLPRDNEGKLILGKVRDASDEALAATATREVTLAMLSTLKAELGSLSRVKRIVRVGFFVNCADTYTRQPQVANGCSDLLVEIFGERGRHARAAIGNNALPLGAIVEADMVVEVE